MAADYFAAAILKAESSALSDFVLQSLECFIAHTVIKT